MFQKEMILADKLDCLTKTSQELNIAEEASLLQMEVEHTFVELLLNPKVKRMKMWIYTDWSKMSITYRIEESGKKKEQDFKRKYNPNMITSLLLWATNNGLKVNFSSPNEKYPKGLLTLEYPNPDRKK